jgi:hypothetical protein
MSREVAEVEAIAKPKLTVHPRSQSVQRVCQSYGALYSGGPGRSVCLSRYESMGVLAVMY